MRVLYDHQTLFLQKYGGVSRYFYEVINGIRKIHPEDELKVRAAVSVNYYFRDEIRMREKRPAHFNDPVNHFSIYTELAKARFTHNNFDIVHPTFYYDDYLYRFPGLLSGSKVVVTIHDMIHEKFDIDPVTIEAKKASLHRADGIIAVSGYTKKDLLEIYPELESKPIKVIYHGSSLTETSEEAEMEFPEKYILFVGQRGDYKNFIVLLKAFEILSEKTKDLFLVVSGGGDFTPEEREQIEKPGIRDRILKYDLSDSELAKAYKYALALVFPSKYEGFGIPIMEAFSQECPVILSNATCFPEIAGDAGLYFDPDSPGELAQTVMDLYYNDGKRKDMTFKGRERLKSFSWDRAAAETRDFYLSLLG